QDSVQVVLRALGDEVQARHDDARDLAVLEAEVEHGEVGPLLLVGVLFDAVLLDAVAQLALPHLEVALEQPLLAVDAVAFEDDDVGPEAGLRLVVQLALADADRPVHAGAAAEEADAAGLRVLPQEFLVGQAAGAVDLVLAHGFTGSRSP